MIKIEFKEATECHWFILSTIQLGSIFMKSIQIKSITPYIPTQDPMLDREYILIQLGITKEQDEANQKEWIKL